VLFESLWNDIIQGDEQKNTITMNKDKKKRVRKWRGPKKKTPPLPTQKNLHGICLSFQSPLPPSTPRYCSQHALSQQASLIRIPNPISVRSYGQCCRGVRKLQEGVRGLGSTRSHRSQPSPSTSERKKETTTKRGSKVPSSPTARLASKNKPRS